jgi:hypothetical protein
MDPGEHPILAELRTMAGPDAAALHYLAARAWARAGAREGALWELDAAMRERPELQALAMNDPDLRPQMAERKERGT